MIWYPSEPMKTMRAPYTILDAEGVYLYTQDGPLIDSVSSWWSVIHGYKHPEMNKAIISQAEKFSHVMLGGLTHEPVLRLAARLQSWLPGDLDYSFFSDSGSTRSATKRLPVRPKPVATSSNIRSTSYLSQSSLARRRKDTSYMRIPPAP